MGMADLLKNSEDLMVQVKTNLKEAENTSYEDGYSHMQEGDREE